jgi:hypothetical protein
LLGGALTFDDPDVSNEMSNSDPWSAENPVLSIIISLFPTISVAHGELRLITCKSHKMQLSKSNASATCKSVQAVFLARKGAHGMAQVKQ